MTPQALARLASMLSRETKIAVVFDELANSSSYNTHTQTLTIGLFGKEDMTEDALVGLVLHEAGHVRHTKAQKAPEHWSQVHNHLEDHRIDALARSEYEGAAFYQAALYDPLIKAIQKNLGDLSFGLHLTEGAAIDTPGLRNRIQRYISARAELIARGAHASSYVLKRTEADYPKLTQVIEAYADLLKRAERVPDESALLDLVAEAQHLLAPFLPSLPQQPHAQGGSRTQPGAQEGSSIERMREELGGLERGYQRYSQARYSTARMFPKAAKNVALRAALLKRRLLTLMRDNDHQRYEGGHKKGTLNKKALHKVARGNYRVYQKRLERKGKKYAVAIALDTSGSMFNTGSAQAGHDVALLMAQVMRGLDIPCSIVLYGGRSQTILEADERLSIDELDRQIRLCSSGVYCAGDTNILGGIETALDSIAHHQDRHRVLIIVNDGGIGTDGPRARQLLEQVDAHVFYVLTNKQCIAEREYLVDHPEKLVPSIISMARSLNPA